MMQHFLEILDTRGKAKLYTVWMMVACLIYAICYQLISQWMYSWNQTMLLYVGTYGLHLLAGAIPALMTIKIQKSQEEVCCQDAKKMVVTYVLVQTILFMIMNVLGYASFTLASSNEQGILAYVVNLLLVLVVLFYIPVQMFCLQQLRKTCSVIHMLGQSLKTIFHQYQPVFYSCLLLAIVFVGYRYLMQAVFQFQMNVALYDLPAELLIRYVPFLDVVSLGLLMLQNSALVLPFFFAFFFSIVQCGALVLFIYYIGCIQRKEDQE